jgi:hypothetical protein
MPLTLVMSGAMVGNCQATAEALAEAQPVPMERVGNRDLDKTDGCLRAIPDGNHSCGHAGVEEER